MSTTTTQRHPESPIEEPFWWACTEPERPADYTTMYNRHCKWCLAKVLVDIDFLERVGCGMYDDGESPRTNPDARSVSVRDWHEKALALLEAEEGAR